MMPMAQSGAKLKRRPSPLRKSLQQHNSTNPPDHYYRHHHNLLLQSTTTIRHNEHQATQIQGSQCASNNARKFTAWTARPITRPSSSAPSRDVTAGVWLASVMKGRATVRGILCSRRLMRRLEGAESVSRSIVRGRGGGGSVGEENA